MASSRGVANFYCSSVQRYKSIDNRKKPVKFKKLIRLKGANMDIDLTSSASAISWKQDKCPWNTAEKTNNHKCAVKNTSICDYFQGIEPPDTVFCSYTKKHT